MRGLDKLRSIVREQGAQGAARAVAREIKQRSLDSRELMILKVDLTQPQHRLRARDREATPMTLLPFDRAVLPRLKEMLERDEPLRIPIVEQRLAEGVSGVVAEEKGELTGYVFWVRGSDDASRHVHRDLEWLGVRPQPDEIYVFDYFVPARLRGKGSPFIRYAQEAQFQQGFRTAYGYVYVSNRPATWLYRTTGWTEVRRMVEHRLMFDQLVLIDDVLWRMHRMHRSRIARIPGVELLPLPRGSTE